MSFITQFITVNYAYVDVYVDILTHTHTNQRTYMMYRGCKSNSLIFVFFPAKVAQILDESSTAEEEEATSKDGESRAQLKSQVNV